MTSPTFEAILDRYQKERDRADAAEAHTRSVLEERDAWIGTNHKHRVERDEARALCRTLESGTRSLARQLAEAREAVAFLSARLVNVYGESPNLDYHHKAAAIVGEFVEPSTVKAGDKLSLEIGRALTPAGGASDGND